MNNEMKTTNTYNEMMEEVASRPDLHWYTTDTSALGYATQDDLDRDTDNSLAVARIEVRS